jgi:hypothetical protein
MASPFVSTSQKSPADPAVRDPIRGYPVESRIAPQKGPREASDQTIGSSRPDHDHAWRRTKGPNAKTLIDGEYRCDICDASWSM